MKGYFGTIVKGLIMSKLIINTKGKVNYLHFDIGGSGTIINKDGIEKATGYGFKSFIQLFKTL